MKKIVGLAILSGALYATGAAAFDKQGQYIVHGAGDTSCREWIADRGLNDAGAWQLQQWLLGYLTAYNEWVRGRADILEGTDAPGFFSDVDKYCAANQVDTLSDAVVSLVTERR